LALLTQFSETITRLLPQIKEKLKSENDAEISFSKFIQQVDSVIEESANTNNELEVSLKEAKERCKNVLTKSAKNWVTPVDKLSNVAFDSTGTLYDPAKFIGVIISKKSKKELLTMVKLNLEKEDNILINDSKRELDPYDRIVHDAVVSLYVDTKNEYITPQMVYRAMTGNPEAKLNPKQQELVSNSLDKLTRSRITIYATKEVCEAYGIDKFSYSGMVIAADKVEITIKGNVVEAYRLLRKPILYEYADKLNQIGRFDIKILNTPVKKNEETLILQDYLYRRILAMKGASKLNHNIVYNTVYEYLNLTATSEASLWNKKSKIRKTVKVILDYWKNEGFIISYTENKENNSIVSVTIKI